LVENRAQTDSELIQRIAEHDSKAIEQLYDRYSPLLYTLIKKIAVEKEIAEEILSDVFVIIWKRIDHFDHNTNNVFIWLVLLARNKTLDVLKRRKGGHEIPEYNEEYETENILPKLSSEIRALEFEEALKMGNKISNALNELTEAQKLVLRLSYFEGMDEKDIAGRLKIPATTVKSKLQVAIGILLEKLSKQSNKEWIREITLN